MTSLGAPFPSGRLVLVVLAASIAVWAAMVFGTLAHLRALAGGLDPFDMRPLGYSHDEAKAFLTAIGEQGREFYARVQLRIDTVYPALYAASRMLVILWLTAPGRVAGGSIPAMLRWTLLAPPALAALFDYRENAAISGMVASGPGPDATTVAAASLATQIKSIAGLVTEVSAIILAVLAGFGWWRRRAGR